MLSWVITALCAWSGVEAVSPYRLPVGIQPNSYDITLFTYLDKYINVENAPYTYDGHVTIRFKVATWSDPLSTIVLNSFNNTVINEAKMKSNAAAFAKFDRITDMLYIDVDPPLEPGSDYELFLSFTGHHSDNKKGFYRVSYHIHGDERFLLATDFQPTSARRAFPCFDEPRLKAKFKLTIVYSQALAKLGYHAMSNTPIDFTEEKDGAVWVHFRETPEVMSTYLLAFILSDFEKSGTQYFHHSLGDTSLVTETQQWGAKNLIATQDTNLSAIVAPAIAETLQDLFKIDFSFEKLDHVSLPRFSMGAMENWGMIIYRPELLFPDPDAPLGVRMQSAMVVAHEVVHQWFGNMITADWWSNLWLNEGFADFFQFYALSRMKSTKMFPETWHLENQMVSLEVQSHAFVADYQNDSRALQSEVNTLDEVFGRFNEISYSKGASVIRMWMYWIGENTFMDALRTYLKRWQYMSVTPWRLMDAFDEAHESAYRAGHSGSPSLPLTVPQLFQDWYSLPGYPLVSVYYNKLQNFFNITQKRFHGGEDNGVDYRWHIPITYSTDREPKFNDTVPRSIFLKNEPFTLVRPKLKRFSWYILNNRLTGYYRVNYEMSNWEALRNALYDPEGRKSIDPINRAQIVDDVMILAERTDEMPYSTALDILGYLQFETNFTPWRAGTRAIRRHLIYIRDDKKMWADLIKFSRFIVESAMNNLENNDEDVINNLLCKEEMIVLLSALKGGTKRSKQLKFFDHFKASGNKARALEDDASTWQKKWRSERKPEAKNWLRHWVTSRDSKHGYHSPYIKRL